LLAGRLIAERKNWMSTIEKSIVFSPLSQFLSSQFRPVRAISLSWADTPRRRELFELNRILSNWYLANLLWIPGDFIRCCH
jgi:hypothetical protein